MAIITDAPSRARVQIEKGYYRNLAALYRSWDWSVIPLKVGTKLPGERWKPKQRELPTQSQVMTWWGVNSKRGIGIVCGQVSGGLMVRDWDDPASYLRWRDENPELAATVPTVKTRRGYHCYYIDAHDRTASHKVDGGEIRGDGNYVVAPGVTIWIDKGQEIEPVTYEVLVPMPKDQHGRPALPRVDFGPFKIFPAVSDTAYSAHTADSEHREIEAHRKNLPLCDITGPGQRNAALWDLAMAYRNSVEEWSPLDAEKLHDAWWGRNSHHANTDEVESLREFVSMVERVETGTGFEARAHHEWEFGERPGWIDEINKIPIRRVALAMVALDRAADGKSFFRSTRQIAAMIGEPNHRNVYGGLGMLERYGFIEIVDRGTPGRNGQAATYRLLRNEDGSYREKPKRNL